MLERQSAIASALAKGGRDGADGRRRLKLGEQRGGSLIQLAAFASTLSQLEQAAAPLLGAALPTEVGKVVVAGPRQLLRTGPEQFWILGPAADDLAARLQGAIDPSIGAVTPLSHSRTRIIVEGAPARELLIQGIPLDLHGMSSARASSPSPACTTPPCSSCAAPRTATRSSPCAPSPSRSGNG